MQLVWVMIVGLALFGLGCDEWFVEAAERTREGDTRQQFGEISKVKVDRAGTIYLNGKIVTIEGLKQEFPRLKQANGAVWYYRENSQGRAAAASDGGDSGHYGCKSSRAADGEGL